MAKCSHCGFGLNPGQRICPKCYRDALAEEKASQFDGMQVASPKRIEARPGRSITDIVKIVRRVILIMVLGVFISFVVAFLVFFRKVRSGQTPPTTSEQRVTESAQITRTPDQTANITEIVQFLEKGDEDAKTQACYRAGQLSPLPRELIQPVMAHINDPAQLTSCACAWAIGNAAEAAVEALPQLLQLIGADSQCSGAAAESAGKIGAPAGNAEVKSVLTAALGNLDNEQLRRSAAAGLKEYGIAASEAIPALVAASSDLSAEVRLSVLMTLSGFAQTSGSVILPALIGRLQDSEANIRGSAAETLATIGPEARDAIPNLAKMINDPDEYAAGQALNALGAIGRTSGETIPHLIRGLQHRNHSIRKFAVLRIGEMGPLARDAVPALIPILSGEEIYLRVWAAEALGNIGPAAKAAVPRLKEMQQEKIVSNEMEAAQLPQTISSALRKIEGR